VAAACGVTWLELSEKCRTNRKFMWIGHFYGAVSIVFYWQPAKEIHRTFIKLIGICCVNGRELIGDMLKGRRKKAAAVQDRRNNLTPPKPFVTFNCP
jgi:hypothetical protein